MNDQNDNTTVSAWFASVSIPTYGIGEPDRNPMFLEKRVYQGSSGAVYPLPVVDRILDEKHDQEYRAALLENEYLKIMILPELGGRVQMALDKTNQYHFVYYNRVIKPALVGLAGPWISGGLEFNWPQHHRPSTFLSVDCDIVKNPDGSQTIWCSEIDRMSGTKGMHGFTLYPGKAYLEIKVRLFNRTALPQTFLWWANPAVHVDEHHQSIFPPDVHAVMDHGKRDVSSFPIATGTYYKVNYAPGTDISRYRNIPVPTSYMAYQSKYDFVGSYDHGRRAGLLHVASHHISPGKKQWTWGHGDFGQAWDRELTDEDGPYIELMCGVFTDNQPDFSWLMPGEERSFSQFFLPYKGVGAIKNATLDAAVGLETAGTGATLRIYTTAVQTNCRVTVRRGESVLLQDVFDSSPHAWYERTFPCDSAADQADLCVTVWDQANRELVSWQADAVEDRPLPAPAQAIAAARELDSVESLFLAGTHLEQYRHATREPADYYREALRRDPGDARCNNALGRLLLRRGCFTEAETHFRQAIARLTRHNPNPYDGEPYYNLGLALVAQQRFDEAQESFFKATWNAAWQESAFFQLARLALRGGDHATARQLLAQCLDRNAGHHQAVHLQAYLGVCSQQATAAQSELQQELARDPFNTGLLFELAQLSDPFARLFQHRMRDDSHNYLELAMDYAAAGLYQRAVAVLEQYLERVAHRSDTPLVHYHLADYYRRLGHLAQYESAARRAAEQASDYCFPNRLESLAVLTTIADLQATDAKAPYYLGNLWFDKRQYERAIACWERSRDLDPSFPTVWRNLGLAYYNKRHDPAAAWHALQQAHALDAADARILYELDQLAKRLGHDPSERLTRLEQHPALIDKRDDLYLERITLLNQLGHHQSALDAILARRFHPWEGGEGKVPAQFVLAITQLARSAMDAGRFPEAIDLLRQTQQWPKNLGEGKLAGIQENNICYLLGCAASQLAQRSAAEQWFQRASVGLSEPASALYYNDQPPDMIFYQGLALEALGQREEAARRFQRLIDYGQQHLDDPIEIDYFAVSLPDFLVFDDDLNRRNVIHCRYMMGLGQLGLGNTAEATDQFDQLLALDVNHLGAIVHRRLAHAAGTGHVRNGENG